MKKQLGEICFLEALFRKMRLSARHMPVFSLNLMDLIPC